jgi:hypothetical protein
MMPRKVEFSGRVVCCIANFYCSRRPAPAPHLGGTAANYPLKGDTAMRTTVFALIALSVLVGAATPAGAFNPKEFWEQQDRFNGGSNGR